jgi:dsRNA-specific ribonuclease
VEAEKGQWPFSEYLMFVIANSAGCNQADNLLGSGVETVVAQSLYAVIGAIALERGGELANKIVKEKILIPLGLSS